MICLCPAPNLQGGQHIFGLRTRQLNKRTKLDKIPLTYVVIKVFENGRVTGI